MMEMGLARHRNNELKRMILTGAGKGPCLGDRVQSGTPDQRGSGLMCGMGKAQLQINLGGTPDQRKAIQGFDFRLKRKSMSNSRHPDPLIDMWTLPGP